MCCRQSSRFRMFTQTAYCAVCSAYLALTFWVACDVLPTLQINFCRRHPPVIAQPTKLLFERMVRIKQLIPQSDVSLVVAKRPSLLCMEVC